MSKHLSRDTRGLLLMRGLFILSLRQIPQADGRRLKNCVEPADPWSVALADDANPLRASVIRMATGATAEDAVTAAMRLGRPSDLKGALGRLAAACDDLAMAYGSRHGPFSLAAFNQPCTMGVGCDEAGMCYAAAMGDPERCPRG